MRYLIMLVAVVTLLVSSVGCGNFSQPVTPVVLNNLTPEKAEALVVYSANHGTIFDLRLHTIYTCPFLSYTPNYFYYDNKESREWAEWLYWFFENKHKTEDHCSCVVWLQSRQSH
jgi:hypothetical protein